MIKITVLTFLLSISNLCLSQTLNSSVSIIPQPASVVVKNGTYEFPATVRVRAKVTEELKVSAFIEEWLRFKNRKVTIVDSGPAEIVLSGSSGTITKPEAYGLNVNESGVNIVANSGAGLFYGLQSLMQLSSANQGTLTVPFVEINDEPKFKWRGSMLDVARHYFPVSFIKKYIDLLAFYKINTFHWHLTDDQGWRIEIKKYPRLTQVSAYRKETLIGEQQLAKSSGSFVYDGIHYGGFYTPEEIKDIVAYAQARYVTIVPEIEMPGHTLAVLAAYPELACKPGPYEVLTKWGVSEDIICPTEVSFRFFEDVLSEVTQLFPGTYVHIGGDEAPKKVWKESEDVKKIMAKNKIADVEKVQGWFNARIEKFLMNKGKKMVGWDEILEGGITKASTVMSWRGEEGGIEAAKKGNDVVMSPNGYLYLDYGQHPVPHHPSEPISICCYLPIEKIYNYNPLPSSLSAEMQKHILGVQANLWTEYVTTTAKAEYALFPRLLALSETAWTDPGKKDFTNFSNRVSSHFAMLDEKQVNYRVPEPGGLTEPEIRKNETHAFITLTSAVPAAKIVYTLDGHLPDETTEIYTGPITIPLGRHIKVTAATIAPNGRRSTPVELVVE